MNDNFFADQLTRVYAPLMVQQLNSEVPLYGRYFQRAPKGPWDEADAWERSLSLREEVKRQERVAWALYEHERKVDRALGVDTTPPAAPPITALDFLAIT